MHRWRKTQGCEEDDNADVDDDNNLYYLDNLVGCTQEVMNACCKCLMIKPTMTASSTDFKLWNSKCPIAEGLVIQNLKLPLIEIVFRF